MGEVDCRPLISVIVPVYKVEPYLHQCVDSILSQTYTNLEIILVDDGSPDRCGEICDAYAEKDGRVQVIHKENGGVSSARNAALEIVTGKYLLYIDSDDYVDPDYVEQLFLATPADVVVSNSSNLNGSYTIQEVIQKYYTAGFSGPCEKLYLHSKIKDLRFREDLEVGEDIIYNIAVLKVIENCVYLPYSGYHIVSNMQSLTRKYTGKYDPRLDEEQQRKWGQLLSSERRSLGVVSEETKTMGANACSIWIFQKIKNYCYSDCPHDFKTRLKRIKNQLDWNRTTIMQVKNPSSPKTFFIIKLCTLLKHPIFAFLLFKLIIFLKL